MKNLISGIIFVVIGLIAYSLAWIGDLFPEPGTGASYYLISAIIWSFVAAFLFNEGLKRLNSEAFLKYRIKYPISLIWLVLFVPIGIVWLGGRVG